MLGGAAVVCLIISLSLNGIDGQWNEYIMGFDYQPVELKIISVHPVEFNITSPHNSYSYTGATTNNNNAISTIPLPSDFMISNSSYTYRHRGVRLSSNLQIQLLGASTNSTMATTSFHVYPYRSQPAKSYIYISDVLDGLVLVSGRSNTMIGIVPSCDINVPSNPQLDDSTLTLIPVGATYSITLHYLQSYIITNSDCHNSSITTNNTITITSNNPLSLIARHGDGHTQLLPTINWGTRFLLAPLLHSPDDGQQFQVTTSEINTVISNTCENTTITANVSYTFRTSQYCELICSHRCYVTQSGYSMSLLMSVPPTFQYSHSVCIAGLDLTSNFYNLIIPANAYFNGSVIINNTMMTMLNWTTIYSVTGSISGYGYTSMYNGVLTVSHSHPSGRLYVASYSNTYGYVAGSMVHPNIPQIMFEYNQYCILDEWNPVNVILKRIGDVNVDFIVNLRINTDVSLTNYTIATIEFSTDESEKQFTFNLTDYFNETESNLITLSAETVPMNSYIIQQLAVTTLIVQNYSRIGFITSDIITNGDTLVIDIQHEISEVVCDNYTVNVLLQLKDTLSNVVNVSRIEFNAYIRSRRIEISIDRLTFQLNLEEGGLIMTASLLGMSSNIILNPSEANIYYIPSFISITESSMITTPTISVNMTQPTETPKNIFLDPAISYIIGISSTIFTSIACCFVVVVGFCCGRFCCPRERQSLNNSTDLNVHESSGHFVITKPYQLSPEGDAANDSPHRIRSQRRPPPPPPGSRPLPMLPLEVYENVHSKDSEL